MLAPPELVTRQEGPPGAQGSLSFRLRRPLGGNPFVGRRHLTNTSMPSPEVDALLAAVRGVLHAELRYRRALLQLAEIPNDEELAKAFRSRRADFMKEIAEIRHYCDLLGFDCASERRAWDVADDEGPCWETFTRR